MGKCNPLSKKKKCSNRIASHRQTQQLERQLRDKWKNSGRGNHSTCPSGVAVDHTQTHTGHDQNSFADFLLSYAPTLITMALQTDESPTDPVKIRSMLFSTSPIPYCCNQHRRPPQTNTSTVATTDRPLTTSASAAVEAHKKLSPLNRVSRDVGGGYGTATSVHLCVDGWVDRRAVRETDSKSG